MEAEKILGDWSIYVSTYFCIVHIIQLEALRRILLNNLFYKHSIEFSRFDISN